MIAINQRIRLLREYDVSPDNGFLPDGLPLQRLSNPYYDSWEDVISQLPQLIATKQVRKQIDSLPLLNTTHLKTKEEWRRAYVVLGFMAHAYIWGGERPSEILPVQIAQPFLLVADQGGLPTTANYAALVLWNFGLRNGHTDLTRPEYLRSLVTMTGTRSEEWFYLVSVAVEAHGGPLILAMLDTADAIQRKDEMTVVQNLQFISEGIEHIGSILKRMHEECDPQVFYHHIRPFLAGSKGMAAAGLKQGVFYDEGEGKGRWRQYSGGSNAQSALIQLFDIFLQVDHHATGGTHVTKDAPSNVGGFIKEMRRYMPEKHSDFLSYMTENNHLREYISRSDASYALRETYNKAVAALVEFRNIHIQIVSRYIIQPSRSPPASYITQKNGTNLATASSLYKTHLPEDASDPQGLQGTGGTVLIPFLKRTRDETREMILT